MTQILEPKKVDLDLSGTEYVRLLGGPPETASMRSGYVVILPGNSVGRHSTENFEEILVVLEGDGELLVGDGSPLQLKPFTVTYCPPRTEHDVRCTGSKPLRYVYIVAKA